MFKKVVLSISLLIASAAVGWLTKEEIKHELIEEEEKKAESV